MAGYELTPQDFSAFGVASLNGLSGILSLTSTSATLTITPSGTHIDLELNTSKANTWTAAQAISGASFTLSGTQSAAAWGTAGILFKTIAATYIDTSSSGTVTNNMINAFAVPIIAANSPTTYTHAATLYIAGQPSAGTNTTLTNSHALYINGGSSANVAGIAFAPKSAQLITQFIYTTSLDNMVIGNISSGKTIEIGNANFTVSSNGTQINKIFNYAGITTAGIGIPAIYGVGLNVSLDVVSTTIASYTPTSISQMFIIKWSLSCVTSSTPTIQVTYSDATLGAVTVTLYNTAMTGGTTAGGVFPIVASSSSAITVTGSDSVALGDVFASATIVQEQ